MNCEPRQFGEPNEMGWYRHRCRNCGIVFAPSPDIPLRKCDSDNPRRVAQQHYLTCRHRGRVIEQIIGSEAGVGCASSHVDVYECLRFNEPVLKAAATRCKDRLRHSIEGYTGRTCRECEVTTPSKEIRQAVRFTKVSSLVVVTAYFNPQKSTRRLQNYLRFERGLSDHGIQLLTVEGIRNGTPELTGENILHVQCEDILWQKERLINIGIRSLPDDVDAVGWFDGDLLFDRRDLRAAILDGLRRWPILQPWSHCQMLGPSDEPTDWQGAPVATSLGASNQGKGGNSYSTKKHPGFAWAMRRDAYNAMGGLHEHHITGGGDTKMAIAFFGNFKSPFLVGRLTEAMHTHWKRWADNAYAVINGQVGWLDGTIRHLYHGEIADRQYIPRSKLLVENDYDPDRDICYAESGALAWSEHASQKLQDDVANYLLYTRKEP